MKIYLVYSLLILSIVGFNTSAKKLFQHKWKFWLCYVLPALSMILFLLKVSKPPFPDWLFYDFNVYYSAGSLIVHAPSKLYDISYMNIPVFALLFTPFTALNSIYAFCLFTILGILAVLISSYFLVKLTKVWGWRKIALFGLVVANGPTYHSLWYGNSTQFVLLLLLAALFCLKNNHEFWLGILLGISSLIKVPIFVLAVYFVLRGRWRVMVGFSLTLLIIAGVSVLLFGLDLNLAWLHHINQYSGKPMSAYNVQSLDSFLARLLTNTHGDITNWTLINVGWRFKVIRYVLLSLLVGTTIWVCWRSKAPVTLELKNLEFSIVLCLSLLISPVSWTHYYLLLLIPFSMYLGNKLAFPDGRVWSSLMVASMLLTSLPVIITMPKNPVFAFLYSRWLVSHYFFGGVLLLGLLLAARHRGITGRESILEEPTDINPVLS